jgi:hypothetical protein
MKKLAVFFLATFVAALILSSCKSQESCAAYGEAKKYKVERRR